MNRNARRRRKKLTGAPDAGSSGAPPRWTPPPASTVAGALLGHAAGVRAAPPVAPAETETLLRRAVALFQAGRFGEAEPLLREVLGRQPGQAAALQMLGVAAQESGRPDEAIRLLQAAVAAAPDYPEAHHNLGLALFLQGRLETAEQHLGRALALRPDYLDAHINLANALQRQGRLAEAEAALARAVRRWPDHAEAHVNLGNVLKEQGRPDEALRHYDRAIQLRPSFAATYNNKGDLLREQGRAEAATECYRRALELDPGDREAESNLRQAMSRLLPGWHFPMLADVGRNEAYARAIERAVSSESRVLDIGTGSGLLAMLAARAGAGQVTACEMLPALARTAEEIVAANGFAGRIRVVNRKSTAMRVGADLPAPANLLIAEIFDGGLLGEGAIPSLRHALANLTTADARVIPAAATVYAMLVEMPRLRAVNPVRRICGFDLSAFDRFRNPAAYRTVALSREEHRALTEPVPVLRFDFRRPPAGERRQAVAVPASADGTCHAVAFWFDLHLDDAITVSSRPGGELRHWEQAVQFLDRDVPVAAGEGLRLVVGHTDSRIYFEL